MLEEIALQKFAKADLQPCSPAAQTPGSLYCTVPFLRNSPRGADLTVVS